MRPPRLLDGRLKLRHLVVVDALTEQGSLVAAAAHLRVTQPALTRTLHELEEILGVELYERHPRGITPTIYGAAFTEHARAVLAQLNQAGRHVSELANAQRGAVTVGIHLAGSNVLLPRAVARLKARRPNISVTIREGNPEGLLAELESGRLDFIVGRIASQLARSYTMQRILYDEAIRIAVRNGHPACELDRPALADLLDFPWILPGTETALRAELEQLFLRQDLPLPESRVECTSILTLRNLLIETEMVAALPSLIVRDDERLTALPVSLEPTSQAVGVTQPAHVAPSPSARALLDELVAVAAELRAAARGPGATAPPRV